jgi:anti-sigma B factor antagonist
MVLRHRARVGSVHMSDVPVRLSTVELDASTIALTGEIDAHTAPDLAARYADLPPGDGDFTIDMSKVEFMDSSGLRVVIELHQRAEQASRRLVLRAPSQPVARLIELSGLTGHLHVG